VLVPGQFPGQHREALPVGAQMVADQRRYLVLGRTPVGRGVHPVQEAAERLGELTRLLLGPVAGLGFGIGGHLSIEPRRRGWARPDFGQAGTARVRASQALRVAIMASASAVPGADWSKPW